MIIAALDTGMRRGEMMALRFAEIDFDRGLVVLRGERTKSQKTRRVPISTQRLRAVLEWLRMDAVGEKKSDQTLLLRSRLTRASAAHRSSVDRWRCRSSPKAFKVPSGLSGSPVL